MEIGWPAPFEAPATREKLKSFHHHRLDYNGRDRPDGQPLERLFPFSDY